MSLRTQQSQQQAQRQNDTQKEQEQGFYELTLKVNPKLQGYYESGKGSDLLLLVNIGSAKNNMNNAPMSGVSYSQSNQRQNIREYKVHREYLTLESNFICEQLNENNNLTEISLPICKEDDISSNTSNNDAIQQFEQILKCFYGFNVQVKYSDLTSCLRIANYLQIETLETLLSQHLSNALKKYLDKIDLKELWELTEQTLNNKLQASIVSAFIDFNGDITEKIKILKRMCINLSNQHFESLFKLLILKDAFNVFDRCKIFNIITEYAQQYNIVRQNKIPNQEISSQTSQLDQLLTPDQSNLLCQLSYTLINPELCSSSEFKQIFHQRIFHIYNQQHQISIQQSYSNELDNELDISGHQTTEPTITESDLGKTLGRLDKSSESNNNNNNNNESQFDLSSFNFVNSTMHFGQTQEMPQSLFQASLVFGLFGSKNALLFKAESPTLRETTPTSNSITGHTTKSTFTQYQQNTTKTIESDSNSSNYVSSRLRASLNIFNKSQKAMMKERQLADSFRELKSQFDIFEQVIAKQQNETQSAKILDQLEEKIKCLKEKQEQRALNLKVAQEIIQQNQLEISRNYSNVNCVDNSSYNFQASECYPRQNKGQKQQTGSAKDNNNQNPDSSCSQNASEIEFYQHKDGSVIELLKKEIASKMTTDPRFIKLTTSNLVNQVDKNNRRDSKKGVVVSENFENVDEFVDIKDAQKDKNYFQNSSVIAMKNPGGIGHNRTNINNSTNNSNISTKNNNNNNSNLPPYNRSNPAVKNSYCNNSNKSFSNQSQQHGKDLQNISGCISNASNTNFHITNHSKTQKLFQIKEEEEDVKGTVKSEKQFNQYEDELTPKNGIFNEEGDNNEENQHLTPFLINDNFDMTVFGIDQEHDTLENTFGQSNELYAYNTPMDMIKKTNN